jgi:hypothetical protein
MLYQLSYTPRPVLSPSKGPGREVTTPFALRNLEDSGERR